MKESGRRLLQWWCLDSAGRIGVTWEKEEKNRNSVLLCLSHEFPMLKI